MPKTVDSISIPMLGTRLEETDAQRIYRHSQSVKEYLIDPVFRRIQLPYSTATPTLNEDGQMAVSGDSIYFRSGGVTYRVQGTT